MDSKEEGPEKMDREELGPKELDSKGLGGEEGYSVELGLPLVSRCRVHNRDLGSEETD